MSIQTDIPTRRAGIYIPSALENHRPASGRLARTGGQLNLHLPDAEPPEDHSPSHLFNRMRRPLSTVPENPSPVVLLHRLDANGDLQAFEAISSRTP
ncbi:MAG: hypothetical protein ACI9BD_000952 [Candidatus Marinamargulisbacteria bacterium]|jgi:hypothetical protein